jgi:hypothetical protein
MSAPSPPRPHEQAEVDDLLRHAELLSADETQPLPARGHEPPLHETPSLAPVALALASPPVGWAPAPSPGEGVRGRGRLVAGLAACGVFLLVVGAAAGAATVLALPGSSVAKARDAARSLVPREEDPPAPAAKERPPVEAPPAAPAAAVPVEALPGPAVDPSVGLVTLPARAKGHRVYVDGKLLHDTTSPAPIPCGARTIKIGSRGSARAYDVPCGGELELP